jgi:hypothetical protein
MELLSYGKPNGDPTRLDRVKAKFQLCPDGMLRQWRLEEVRAKQDEYRDKQAKSGKIGADKRWQAHSDPNGVAIATPMANACPNDSSPSPTPIGYIKGTTLIPTVEEVIASGAELRMTESESRDWFRDMAVSGWADKYGLDIGNWRASLVRHARYLQNQKARNATTSHRTNQTPSRNAGTYNEGRDITGIKKLVR